MSGGKGYRTFDIGGYEVLVGKASRDNDELTFRVAKGPDIWMHVGGETPGSHLVIRLDGKGFTKWVMKPGLTVVCCEGSNVVLIYT